MFKRIISIAVFGTLTGAIASLASILFVEAVQYGYEIIRAMVGRSGNSLSRPWAMLTVVLVPGLGGLVVGLLCMTNREKRPLTLTDTIKSAQSMRFSASLKSGLTTALASIVALSSGASVGQYGPLAHLGATLGATISGFTRATGFTASMGIGCGTAAAIATAFNAPIAGILFAHEVILRHYSLKAFAPVTVSAVTGYIFANQIFQLPPLFRIQFLTPIQPLEFVVFIVIGIGGAYIAALFMRAVLAAAMLAAKLTLPQYLKPAIAGVVLGLVAMRIPEVLGLGDEVIRNTLISRYTSTEMSLIFAAKLLLTALCLGFGFAGGIFSPSLVIGISFGALVGDLMAVYMIDYYSSTVVYAICGMVAVASPVMGAPLTAILIIFELTRNYDLTIAAMISVVFASGVGYQLVGRSIFDVQLKNAGFDLSMGRDKAVMDSRDISGYLTEDFVSAAPHVSLLELRDRLVGNGKSAGYVLDENSRYIGTVHLIQFMELLNNGVSLDQQCGNYATREQVVLTPDTTIWSAMEKVQGFVGESIPVIADHHSGIMLAVVYEATIVQAYMDARHQIRREEYGAD